MFSLGNAAMSNPPTVLESLLRILIGSFFATGSLYILQQGRQLVSLPQMHQPGVLVFFSRVPTLPFP